MHEACNNFNAYFFAYLQNSICILSFISRFKMFKSRLMTRPNQARLDHATTATRVDLI